MAHKLANGNYRHNGLTIKREEVATSYGFGYIWKALGKKFDTITLAAAHIDNAIKEDEK